MKWSTQKSLKWEQRFLTSFVTTHTWHTSVDQCDMAFQNRYRNCAEFAFTCKSANKNSSHIWLNDPNKNVFWMPRQIVVLRSIKLVQASQGNFWNHLLGSFFYGIKPPNNASQSFTLFGVERWDVSKACGFAIVITNESKRIFSSINRLVVWFQQSNGEGPNQVDSTQKLIHSLRTNVTKYNNCWLSSIIVKKGHKIFHQH